jgi:hypothetical protein
VQADYGFQEADVILLVEAHLNANHLAARPGLLQTPLDYYKLHVTMGEGYCTAVGQICFVKKHLQN